MRRRRKRDIVIELTALLDVIMIMIFMVMSENGKLVSEAQSELGAVQQENIEQASQIDELTAELAEALAMLNEGDLGEILEKLEKAENKIEAYQAIDDEVIVINVKLRNNSNNSIRYLSYSKVSDPDSENQIEIRNDEDRDRAGSNLRVFISECTQSIDASLTVVRIVFSYDPSKIYVKDFETIDTALRDAEAQENNENFRYRVNPINNSSNSVL